MRKLAMAAALLVLAGCAGKDEPPVQPSYSEPPPVAAVPVPVPAQTPKDACGASELQHLVGRPRSEIPVPVNPNGRRVTCTTCPVTMDHRADRLNIFFDADTGIIKQVSCG